MTYIRNFVLLSAIMGMLCACAALKNASRMESFDETSRSYRHTLMASDYESAVLYGGQENSASADASVKALKHFRVVYCEIKSVTASEDKQTVIQDAELSYYNKNTMIQRKIVDHQKWQYDPQKKKWLLTSGLPKLK